MQTKKYLQFQSDIYSPSVRKILLRLAGFLFLCLLLFSACMVFTANILMANFGKKQIDENEILLEYLSSALPINADDLFYENIDAPMEERFSSSALTHFFFSTDKYPVEEGFSSYLENSLTDFVDSSKYISGAVVYASTTNTYVASKNFASEQNMDSKTFLNDMIFKYNSNTLEKSQIADRKSNTFLFQLENQTILSKDLTTLAGTPHAIMFVFLDMDQFASSIYKSITSVPYKISIYDSYNNFLYSNSREDQETVKNYLLRLSAQEAPLEQTSSHNYLYCRSNLLRFQYILEISRGALSSEPANPILFYGITVAAVLLLSLLMLSLFLIRFGRPAARLVSSFASADTASSLLPSSTFELLEQQIETMLQENLALKKIVAATSSEAVSSLFSRLIAGQQIGKEETLITLDNTDYGFQLNDIYIAGILYHSGQDFLSAESRFRILNLLNIVFKEFKEKSSVNIYAFLYDEKTIAIVASFVFGTSIASGKAKINALKEHITEALTYSTIPMMLAFGNMYSSIFDLPFSYNEAFRGIHYMVEAVSATAASAANPVQETYPSKSTDFYADDSSENYDEAEENTESQVPSQDFLELIYRRAEQIAKLIWDEKDDQVQSLIERTIEDIFQSDTFSDQAGNCKRLVSAVTSHMISYPFVSDTHLSDVYNQLSVKLKEEGFTSDDLKANVQESLYILCSDFSEALKKQRNPYIMAAQDYIRQHYGSPELSLEEIAENLKIAPNYLSTIFSKNLGKRLFEYINEYRLEKSIELLLNTEKSINDISIESGFGSSRNYIRIFKKYKGLPPGAYRKQHQEQRTSIESEEG